MCGSITVVVYANQLIKALYWLLMHTIGDDKLAFFGRLVSVCGVCCVGCLVMTVTPFGSMHMIAEDKQLISIGQFVIRHISTVDCN